jgi:hypothetical protein
MSLEVYYPQDIRNAILAAENASLRSSAHDTGQYAQGYRDGVKDTLTTIALAFGLFTPTDEEWAAFRIGGT